MKAFSLIELLIVIALMGILAVIVIPNFTYLKGHSKTAEAKTALASLFRSEQSYFFTNGEYSDDLDEINFHFKPSFYLIGFGKTLSSDSSIKIYRGSGVTKALHKTCSLTATGFKAGSSNDEQLTNFRINHKGCLRELVKGTNNCNRAINPKVCL